MGFKTLGNWEPLTHPEQSRPPGSARKVGPGLGAGLKLLSLNQLCSQDSRNNGAARFLPYFHSGYRHALCMSPELGFSFCPRVHISGEVSFSLKTFSFSGRDVSGWRTCRNSPLALSAPWSGQSGEPEWVLTFIHMAGRTTHARMHRDLGAH